MRLIYTRRALRDLSEIRAYIARDNPAAAARVADRIIESVERLKAFPSSGRRTSIAGVRELVVTRFPYMVRYRVRADSIEILTILHGRRQRD